MKNKLLVCLLALSSSACAQKILLINGSNPCKAQAHAIDAELIAKIEHPKDWTVVLFCDKQSWLRVMQDTGQDASTTFAFSEISKHYSYFCGPYLTTDVQPGYRTRPVFIVAHEAGHIIAQTMSEELADEMAERLIAHKPYIDLIRRSAR